MIKGLKCTTTLKNPTEDGTLSDTFSALQGNNYVVPARAENGDISVQSNLGWFTNEACYDNTSKEAVPALQRDDNDQPVPRVVKVTISEADWDAGLGSDAIYTAVKAVLEAAPYSLSITAVNKS